MVLCKRSEIIFYHDITCKKRAFYWSKAKIGFIVSRKQQIIAQKKSRYSVGQIFFQ